MEPTKSGEARVVPIGARLGARLREHRLAVGRPGDGERVFPFDPRQQWGRVVKAAGLSSPLPGGVGRGLTVPGLAHSARGQEESLLAGYFR
jgi:hypothetical protein